MIRLAGLAGVLSLLILLIMPEVRAVRPDNGSNGWRSAANLVINSATRKLWGESAVSADLSIAKSGSPDAVIAGNQVVYTLTVTNNGPNTANTGDVVVRDPLPAGTSSVSLVGSGAFASCTLAVLNGATGCTNSAPMASGEKAVLIYTVTVNPGTPVGFVSNTATVATTDPSLDLNVTNNSATIQTAVGPNADLQLTKTASSASVVAGDVSSVLTYTLSYINSGPSNATAVVISETVPGNLIPVGTITATGLSCNGAVATSGGQFSCIPNAGAFGSNAAGVLPAGAAGTISYQIRAPASFLAGTFDSNGATINSTGPNATPDPNRSNNTQNLISTLVTISADLSVTIADTPDPVTAGNIVTYTVVASNAGPSDARNVVITQVLPSGTTFSEVMSSDGAFGCLNLNNTVTCSKSAMASGASTTITIKARVSPSVTDGTTLSSAATVTSTVDDPNPSNNTSPESKTTVQTNAEIEILKTSNADPVVAGENLIYTITVTNTGASDAYSVRVTDLLETELMFNSVGGTGVFSRSGACSYNSGTRTVVCNAAPGGVLPAGATANITIATMVKCDVPAGNVLRNTATVTWSDGDGNPSNDTAASTSRSTVAHESELVVVKEGLSDITAGEQMEYKITVSNKGPSDVHGGSQPGTMIVEDALPKGVIPILPLSGSNLTIEGPGGFECSYKASTNKVTCLNAAGAAGNFHLDTVLTIVFKVQVSSNVTQGTTISNCASIRVLPPEYIRYSGFGACVPTLVRTSADLTIGKTAAPVTPVPTSNPPAVRAGENIRYTINYGNVGPSDAVNVKITDNVPGNTSVVPGQFPMTVLATGGVYTGSNAVRLVCSHDLATNRFTCLPAGNKGLIPSLDDGVLPAGVTGQFSFDVTVNASVTGGTIIGNAANIASAPNGTIPGTADPNTGNNTTLTTSTPVIAVTLLSITTGVQSAVTVASNPNQTGPIGAISPSGLLQLPGTASTSAAVLPGTQLTYRLVITNNGPSDIVNVQAVDTLPPNVTYVSANQVSGNATFTCLNTGGAVTCNAPLLPTTQPGVDNTATIDIVVRIDPGLKSDLINNASVRGTINGFNQSVGAATRLTTSVQPVSDLLTTKSHTPELVVAGTNVVYTIRVQNNGPSTARMLQIVDQLPTGQTLVSAQVVYPAPLPGGPQLLVCNGATSVTCFGTVASGYSLPPGEFITVQLTVAVDSCTLSGAYTNTATATSMSGLPIIQYNVGSDIVSVVVRPDLAITKVDDPDPVIAGNTLTYSIEAINNGPSCANDLTITDPLPTGTVFVSATASAGGVAAANNPAVGTNGTVRYNWLGVTPPGTRRTLTIVVRVCSDVACDTLLSNTATVSYTPRYPNPLPPAPVTTPPFVVPVDWDKDPNPANNTATATTTVRAQSNLSLTKSGPSTAEYSTTVKKSIISYTLSFSNAGPSNAAGVVIVDTLPKGFTLSTWSIAPPYTVNDVTFSTTTINGITTLRFALKNPFGAANQCATSFPLSGGITLGVVVPIKHPIVTVINSATISTTNCLADSDLANNSVITSTYIIAPGLTAQSVYPASSELSDIQAGSVLFYPIYTSDAASPSRQDSRISMTNVSASESVCVHMFLVDGAACSVLDMFVCLSPSQTTTFLASDLDPDNVGYIMAVATDCQTGLPMAYNCLIGDSYTRFSTGHAASLSAVAVQAGMMFPAGADPNATLVDLKFDGISYSRLPRVVTSDSISGGASNSVMMILNRIGGNLAATGAPIGSVSGLVFDDQEVGYSFTANILTCQFRSILSNSFPRLTNQYSRVIPAGRSGWMKLWTLEDRALLGASINYSSNSTGSGLFSQGHNLHQLSLTDKAVVTIPVYLPTCGR